MLTAFFLMTFSSSSDSARSTTTFDDITLINVNSAVHNGSSNKKSAAPNSASSRRLASLPSPSSEDPPYESVSDIFNRRLRALRKRMQKIEKNEDLLSAYELEKLKLSKQKSSTICACPLNADQLKAIANKSHLAEMISELEHISEITASWLASSSVSSSIVPPPTKSHLLANGCPVNVPNQNPPSTPQLGGKEVLELWMALYRLDTLPSGFLANEDLMSLQSANSIIQSLMGAPDQQKSLESIISWMSQSSSAEDTERSNPSAEDNLFSFGPSYSLVRYCIKKILASPASLLHPKSEKNPTKIEEKNLKPKKTEEKNVPPPSIVSTPTPVSVCEENTFVQWNILPSLDSAIIETNNSFLKEDTMPKKQPAFVLKKLQATTLPASEEEPAHRPRHQKKLTSAKQSAPKAFDISKNPK